MYLILHSSQFVSDFDHFLYQFLAKLKIMDYSLLIGLHTLPEAERHSQKQFSDDFLFYRDFKGFQSSFEDNSNGPEVYYLGTLEKIMARCV